MTIHISGKYHLEQQQFITKLQPLLLFSSWSLELLEETSLACGFDKNYHYVLFPEGVRGVLQLMNEMQDTQMLQYLSTITVPIKIRERISLALKNRIKSYNKLLHIKNHAYYLLPANILFATKLALCTCDTIWHYAGDKATDFNHYSKRGLLLSVYSAATLFYIADDSEDMQDTDDFIDSAIAGVINIAKLKKFLMLPALSNIPVLRLFS